MSKRTKKMTILTFIFWFLSVLSNFGLVLGFAIYGLINGEPETRYTMALAGLVGVIVGLASIVMKAHWRTPLIIIIAGLYFTLKHFAPVLLVISIGIVLDELIFTPLYNHFREKRTINKEIDIREN